MNVLFVCGKNRLRSPTAEHVFADWPGVKTAAAGVDRDADVPVTAELLDWAELVLVMEQAHKRKLAAKFRAQLGGKRVVCLRIADDYDYMAPALVALLTTRVSPYLPCR